ncbi:MAG TPA: aminomethyl-transferring glycine dehydrogenase subunit GcvPA [Bacillota bacterium]
MKYLPNTEEDRREMLASIGVRSIEDLFADIPAEVKFKGQMKLPAALSEPELLAHLSKLAASNGTTDKYACFLGGGVYDHFVPSTVPMVLARNEFYTAYTPYQPEVSQGVLQSIFEYQTVICQITGMDVAQASMYDGGTAVAEAALMACAVTGRKEIVVSEAVHPEYRAVLATYIQGQDVKVIVAPTEGGQTNPDKLASLVTDRTAGVIVANPNFFGCLEPVEEIEKVAHAKGALYVTSVNPISLGVLKAPGDYGADIVCGEGQPLGNTMAFGGPYLGFFACKEKYVRRMAGRIIGQTTDVRGQRAWVLTLQTREQHIRREKATSNICSNEALNALAALVYLVTMGKQGLHDVAELCLQKAHYAAKQIAAQKGYELAFKAPFFNEFAVKTPVAPEKITAEMMKKNILPGLDLGRFYPAYKNHLLVAVTELRTKDQIDALAAGLGGLK